MDSEELLSRYQLLPIPVRLLIAFVIGLLPAYYVYLEEGDGIETQLTEAKQRLSDIETKFEKERVKRNKLPELEAKLAFTEQQLKESAKRLPDNFFMNDVLQDTATIARDVGVELQVFDPGGAVAGGDAFKYMEMPIDIEVVGRYSQIAGFYDRLANLEKMVHVRNVRLSPRTSSGKGPGAATGSEGSETDPQAQRAARQDFRIVSTAAMVIYRAMTPAEEARLAAPPGPKDRNGAGSGTPNSEKSAPGAQPENQPGVEKPAGEVGFRPVPLPEKIAVGQPVGKANF